MELINAKIERRLKGEKEPLPGVATVAVFHMGRLLMGKRRDDNKYTVPGGHLEPGETAIMGALRELREETGIQASGLEHLVSQESKNKTIHCFKLITDDGRTFATRDPDKEVIAWEWVDCEDGLPAEIVAKLHVPAEHNVILQALGFV